MREKIGKLEFEFNKKQQRPKEPFIKSGELWHTGWDIPTRYVIDANKQCWMDNAHGFPLERVESQRLLNTPEDIHTTAVIRKALGMKPLVPSWITTALKAGWTPPEDFDISKYS